MITENIRPILMVTGAMTFGATVGFFLFPRQLLRRVFGFEDKGLAVILVTIFSGLVGSLTGVLLFWAAFNPSLRVLAATVGIGEKISFAAVVFLGPLKKYCIAKWAAAGDSLMAMLFVAYLLGL